MTGHFLDFGEEVARVRGNMIAEINGMVARQPDILCKDGDFAITRRDDDYTIATVFHSFIDDSVCVKADNGTIFEINELSTDDLVALYEFVFGVRYPEQN